MIIFMFSIGVLSVAILNIIYMFLNGVGIYNCWTEMRSNAKTTPQHSDIITEINEEKTD